MAAYHYYSAQCAAGVNEYVDGWKDLYKSQHMKLPKDEETALFNGYLQGCDSAASFMVFRSNMFDRGEK